MKKTLLSFAALGALCAAPLFAQEAPRANQPDPPLRPGQDDNEASPRATQPRTTQPRQNAEERQAAEARPAGQVRPAGQAQPGTRAPHETNVQDTRETDFAQHVAACLILANEAEIALTEPAIEKLQNPEARELAQMIVKDHTAYIAKLKPHAPQAANLKLDVQGADHAAASAASARPNAEEANSTTNAAHADATRAQRSAGESLADKALRVDKAYHEKKVQMLSERLNKEQGVNFEQAFLGCQIAGHVSMLAKLQALETEVQDQELSQLIKQGQQSTQEHLQMAEKLMNQEKNVEDGQGQPRSGAASQSRTPNQNRATDAAPATPNRDR